MIAVDVGHRIIITILHGLNILLWLVLLNLWILFLHCVWGRNGVNDIVEVVDLMLKLYDGILGMLKSTHVLLLHLIKLYR